jgi:hypothetical protein
MGELFEAAIEATASFDRAQDVDIEGAGFARIRESFADGFAAFEASAQRSEQAPGRAVRGVSELARRFRKRDTGSQQLAERMVELLSFAKSHWKTEFDFKSA